MCFLPTHSRKSGSQRYAGRGQVLTSAVVKIARVMRLPVGLELYRGLGGTLELPKSFSEVDENGCDKRRDNNHKDKVNNSHLRVFDR